MRVTKASLAHSASRPTEAKIATMSGVSTRVSVRIVRISSPLRPSSPSASVLGSGPAGRAPPR